MEKYNNSQRFTRTELLVVIVLIAVMGSLILLFSSTDAQGKDAAIQRVLSEVQRRAEIISIEYNNFNRVCGNNGEIQDPEILDALSDVARYSEMGQTGITCATPVLGEYASAWAISAKLNDQDGYWCADDSGFSGYTDVGLLGPIDTSCE